MTENKRRDRPISRVATEQLSHFDELTRRVDALLDGGLEEVANRYPVQQTVTTLGSHVVTALRKSGLQPLPSAGPDARTPTNS